MDIEYVKAKLLFKQLVINEDYYIEDNSIIYTEKYHTNRGSCCGCGCRHCPYEPKSEKGNTVLKNTNP